jgi:hypothetical protein
VGAESTLDLRFFPMMRRVQRLQNGKEDSIRDYYAMIGEMAQRKSEQ